MLGESYQIKQIFIKKGLGFNISKDTFLASRKKALHIMYYLGPIPSEISFRENCDFPLKSKTTSAAGKFEQRDHQNRFGLAEITKIIRCVSNLYPTIL